MWLQDYIHWMVFIAFLVFLFYEYNRHKSDTDYRSVAVQYEPPKGISILRAGLLLDKNADYKDFSAATMELATKGYLTIGKSVDKKIKVPILKRTDKPVKDLSSDLEYLLNKVIFDGNTVFEVGTGTAKKASRLKRGFKAINKGLYAWANNMAYIKHDLPKVRMIFLLKCLIVLLLILVLTLIAFQKYEADIINTLVISFGFFFNGIVVFVLMGKGRWLLKAGLSIFVLFGVTVPLILTFQKHSIPLSHVLLSPVSVLFLSALATGYVYKKIGGLSIKGEQVKKHLLGYKIFIQRIKQDEIKRNITKDPFYVEKVLPFAILFGEADHLLGYFGELDHHEKKTGRKHLSAEDLARQAKVRSYYLDKVTKIFSS